MGKEKETETDTVVISVRVPRELLSRFDSIAEQQRRKRGDLARIVIEDWVESFAAQEAKQGKK